MNEFKYSPIEIEFLQECHRINEDNAPNVGSTEFEDFVELVSNSDFNLCVTRGGLPIGYVICFQDKEPTNYKEQWKPKWERILELQML